MTEPGYLTNQLLIAMPQMGDPNFAQTVALVCDHSSSSALALVLNRPMPMRMGEIFDQLEIKLNKGPLSERQVLRGGPMQTDRGFVVHRAFGEWDSTLKVSDALHVTTSNGDTPNKRVLRNRVTASAPTSPIATPMLAPI